MGGKGDKCIDVKEWSAHNELKFIQIMHQHVKNQKMQTSTFKQALWEEIDLEVLEAVGVKYGVEKLKAKFNRLRKQFREFSEIIGHTGVTWNIQSNVVHAPEDVWQMFYTKNKSYKQYRKRGLENYELLGDIFNNTATTGRLHHAFTQKTPTCDKEREIEEKFVRKSTHVDLSEGVGEEDLCRKSSSESIGPSRKEAKISKMEFCLEAWSMALATKIEANKARAEKYKAQSSITSSSNVVSNPYSIEECMDMLETIEDLNNASYNKALEKFTKVSWRKIFMKMSTSRRRQWLESLK